MWNWLKHRLDERRKQKWQEVVLRALEMHYAVMNNHHVDLETKGTFMH
jgi:hypothetical protein